MASTTPILRFVQCPKCLKVLPELTGIGVYKCGGCGTTLVAKVHSSSAEILGSTSAASSSKKNKSDGWEPDYKKEVFEKQIPTSSDHHEDKDQGFTESFELVSSGESLKEKGKSPVYEKTGTEEITLEIEDQIESGITSTIRNSLNEDKSLNSSDKMNESFRKDHTSLLLRSNSYVYDGSISSIDDNPRTFAKRSTRNRVRGRESDISFVSEDFQSALNLMESENDAPLTSKSKDGKHFVKFRCPEKVDKVKIIRKVDELKSELLEYFHRTDVAKHHFRSGVTARHIEGKFPTKHHKSSFLNPHHRPICCHNVCCHMPETTTSHPYPRQEPQNLRSNDESARTVKRHCRPVSGGAPFVICYNCYRLLQLPGDFLVSTKKFHKLRCGSCHEVLKYFFRPRSRSMPWTPAEAKHPPSENDNKEELDNEMRVPISNELGGDPVSFSEEYGISFGKSFSYDGIVEEEQSCTRKVDGSKLHKLMGYSSARYLMFENLSPGEGRRIGHDR